MDLYFDEVFMFEEIDFAQRYFEYFTTRYGTVVKGALSDTIGLGDSLNTLNVQVDFSAGTEIKDRQIQVALSKSLPASVAFFTETWVPV